MNVRARLLLQGRSPALLGGLNAAERGVHESTAVVRVGGVEHALLLGSTVRGVLRDTMARLQAAQGGGACQDPEPCDGVCCELFGQGDRPGALLFRSALAADHRTLVTSSVAIDRVRRTARRQGELWSEQRAQADFEVLVGQRRPLGDEEEAALRYLLAWVEATGLRLGRRRSSGAGIFDVGVDDLSPAEPQPERAAPARRASPPGYEPVALTLSLTALEPLRVRGPRARDFHSKTLPSLPAQTICGALGWALVRAGLEQAANDLFTERPIRVSDAILAGQGDPPGLWLGAARCVGIAAHRVDLTAAWLAAMLTGNAQRVPRVCPVCGVPMKQARLAGSESLVVGHTQFDRSRRRAREGQLYSQATIPPGACFVVAVEAREDQVPVLAGLDRLLVGGARGRGFGLTAAALWPRAVTSAEARLRASRTTLADAGCGDASRLAVVGLVSPARLSGSLRGWLDDRGLEVVASHVRWTVRGGWDERGGGRRPLGDALAAGSWVAVTGDDTAIVDLESTGWGDADPLSPWWVIRDLAADVADAADDEQANEEGDFSDMTLDATQRDDAVLAARHLCRDHQLPDRSAVRNLLQYATTTDSPREVVLFLRYQATRVQPKEARPFIAAAADHLERTYADDVSGMRTYLGILVRAAEVERKAPESGSGRGQKNGRRRR